MLHGGDGCSLLFQDLGSGLQDETYPDAIRPQPSTDPDILDRIYACSEQEICLNRSCNSPALIDPEGRGLWSHEERR